MEPVDSPEELQEPTQEEQLFYQDRDVKHPGGWQMWVVTGSTCSPCRRQAVPSVPFEVHDEFFSLVCGCFMKSKCSSPYCVYIQT